MIPRYSRPEMTAVWSPETRFRIWFEIEAYAVRSDGRDRRDPESGGEGDLGEGATRPSSTWRGSTRSRG